MGLLQVCFHIISFIRHADVFVVTHAVSVVILILPFILEAVFVSYSFPAHQIFYLHKILASMAPSTSTATDCWLRSFKFFT